jgi:hypothetical protein
MKNITLTPRTERWPQDQKWKITSIRIPFEIAQQIELRAKAAECRSPSDAIIQILAQYVENTDTPRKSAKVFLEWAAKPDLSARKPYGKDKAKANAKSKPKAAKKVKAKAARKTKAAKPSADQPQLPGTANGAEAPAAVQAEPGTVTSGTQPAPEAQAQPEAPATSEAQAQPSQEAQPEAANEPHQDAEPRAAAPSNLGPDGEQMAF